MSWQRYRSLFVYAGLALITFAAALLRSQGPKPGETIVPADATPAAPQGETNAPDGDNGAPLTASEITPKASRTTSSRRSRRFTLTPEAAAAVKERNAELLEALVLDGKLQPQWASTLDGIAPPAGTEVTRPLLEFVERFPGTEQLQQVARTLERIGGVDGVNALYVLGDRYAEIARNASVRLARVRGRDAAPGFVGILRDALAPPHFVSAALRGLGQTRLRQHVAEIAAFARDPEHAVDVRIAATHALGEIADPDALPVLLRLLDERDKKLRRQAIRAVGRIRTPASIEALERIAASTAVEFDRNLAIEGLKRLRGEPVFSW